MRRLVVTIDPAFHDEALDEVGLHARVLSVRELDRGVRLLELEGDDPVAAWMHRPPVFVRHAFEVRASLELTGEITPDLALLVPLAVRLGSEFGQPFSVQTRLPRDSSYRPREINGPVSAAVAEATGAVVDVRHPVEVLSIVIARGADGWVAHMGASRARENLSVWAGGAAVYARDPQQVSRSELKLLEAIEAFVLQLPSGGRALDLGAAPGGWTRVLRSRGMRVVAVDPADLHPAVASDPGVVHERTTAGVYVGRTQDRFDVVVNDLRMDAVRAARLMVRCARLVEPAGFAVTTIKLPRTNGGRAAHRALGILRSGWDVPVARNLFHNRSEITALLRPGS